MPADGGESPLARTARWVGLLLLALVPAYIFRDVLLARKVLITLDTLTYAEPRCAEILRAVAAWRFPLWSPHISAGAPFFAEMDNGILNPWNILIVLFGPRRWMEIAAPLMCALAGLGMYVFLREWRVGHGPALAAGLAYGSGGFLVSYADNILYLAASLYLPWVLLLWHRALARSSPGYLAATAGCLAVMLTPGDAQTVYDAVLLIFAYGFIVPGVRRRWVAPVVAYALLGFAAVALMAVQLVPTLELLRQAPRQLEMAQVYEWSFHPGRLLELLLPFAYGMDLPGAPYWGGFLHGVVDPTPWTRMIYVGLLPLVALPYAFAARATRPFALLLAGFVTFMTAASFGPLLPVYRLLYEVLPLLSRFRVPSKLWILVVFGLAALAGLGLERWRTVGVGRGAVALALALPVIGIAVLCWPASVEVTAALQNPARHLVVAGAAIMLLLGVSHFVPARRSLALAAIVLVHAIDLGAAGAGFARYFGDPRVAPAEPVPAVEAMWADAKRAGELTTPVRIYHDPQLVQGRGFRPPPGLRAQEAQKLWERRSLDWNHGMLWNLEYIGGYTTLQDKRAYALRQLLWRDRSRLAEVLGRFDVRYLLLPQGYPVPTGAELAAEVEGGAVRLARTTAPLPRVFLTRYGRAVADEGEMLATVIRLDIDLGTVTHLELAEADLPFAGVASGAALGEARVDHYESGRVELSIDIPEPRYIVFNESGYAGWRAWVDGAERPMYRANYLMQAVAVRPGERRVTLRYLPRSFVYGAWVSGASWLTLIGFLAWRGVRRRTVAPVAAEARS